MSGFVHLHCHSTWSLLDGAVSAEDLAHGAAERGFDAIALTDHDALTGAVRFSKACRDAGIKPIFGAELTVAPAVPAGTRPQERGSAGPGAALTSRYGRPADAHVTVIARNATGYGNLCRLISASHLTNERGHPVTTPDAIASRCEGLFVLSGCARGEVARLAAAGRMSEAVGAARAWKAAIGSAYRIEVFDHRGYGHRSLRDRLLKVAREACVKPVATNNVHYAGPEQAGIHELLHAIKEIVPLSKSRSLRSTSEHYLKDASAMRSLFDDVDEACDETLALAEECDFDLDLGRYHFPDIPIPAGETPTGLLARRCYEGFGRRYDRINRTAEDRLQHELRAIFDAGFASYFLLVANIVDHVRKVMEVRCACRGSAAGSLVCYVLGISDVDPVRYDLLFERFMNTRREELPDIDVDVESSRREDVLAYILDTYGDDQTAVCCMVDTFRARMAIREAGKALGIAAGEIDAVAKAFPRIAARGIRAAIDHLPELAGSNLKGPQLVQLFDLCEAIDSFPRHLALHPSGVILSSRDLGDRVPMQESFGGFTMLQADKHDVEDLGLVKLDVLGVRMLSSIAHTRAEIARVRGVKLDLDSIPHDDHATYRMIRTSQTLGCFQIESPGQRELLARLQPSCFKDLIVDISLFRPGPVKSDMVGPYLERRHGFEGVPRAHASLAEILAETNGIIVFHEQLIRVIAAATGCTLADADYVRRHLDSDRPAAPGDPDDRPFSDPKGVPAPSHAFDSSAGAETPEWAPGTGRDAFDMYSTGDPAGGEVGAWFVGRARANGFTPDQAAMLWKEVFAFASFGFCKSHAAAFALPTYLSAWLKTHYPAEFFAGVLTHDPGMYPRRLIVADARRHGIAILPIDVNHSDAFYRVEPAGDPGCTSRHGQRGTGVRLALSEVRSISEGEIGSIVCSRDCDGPFASLEDLWRRTELSQPVLENLVHTGALDSIRGPRSRRELLWRATSLCGGRALGRRNTRAGATTKRLDGAGEQRTFGLDEAIVEELAGLPGYSALEETEAEIEVSGMDARRHVMDLYEGVLAEIGCTPAAGLYAAPNKSQVWVAGVKVASQTPAIRTGQRIIFVTLDDPTGPIDVTVFERAQARCAHTVFHSWLLLIHGVVKKRGGASFTQEMDPTNTGITVVVDEAFDLNEIARRRAAGTSLTAALGAQRHRQVASAGPPARDRAPRKLWHSSGGSAGR